MGCGSSLCPGSGSGENGEGEKYRKEEGGGRKKKKKKEHQPLPNEGDPSGVASRRSSLLTDAFSGVQEDVTNKPLQSADEHPMGYDDGASLQRAGSASQSLDLASFMGSEYDCTAAVADRSPESEPLQQVTLLQPVRLRIARWVDQTTSSQLSFALLEEDDNARPFLPLPPPPKTTSPQHHPRKESASSGVNLPSFNLDMPGVVNISEAEAMMLRGSLPGGGGSVTSEPSTEASPGEKRASLLGIDPALASLGERMPPPPPRPPSPGGGSASSPRLIPFRKYSLSTSSDPGDRETPSERSLAISENDEVPFLSSTDSVQTPQLSGYRGPMNKWPDALHFTLGVLKVISALPVHLRQKFLKLAEERESAFFDILGAEIPDLAITCESDVGSVASEEDAEEVLEGTTRSAGSNLQSPSRLLTHMGSSSGTGSGLLRIPSIASSTGAGDVPTPPRSPTNGVSPLAQYLGGHQEKRFTKLEDADRDILEAVANGHPTAQTLFLHNPDYCDAATQDCQHKSSMYFQFEPVPPTELSMVRWAQEVDRSILMIVSHRQKVPVGLISLTAEELASTFVDDFEVFRAVARVSSADTTGPVYESPYPLGSPDAAGVWLSTVLAHIAIESVGYGPLERGPHMMGSASSVLRNPKSAHEVAAFFRRLPTPGNAVSIARRVIAGNRELHVDGR